ncbi:MAG: HAMP domain-containing protein [Alphaproteobacteria bacterium]|nr:HAMP domain-containing protein [Alphaproteobacteria bacterium]
MERRRRFVTLSARVIALSALMTLGIIGIAFTLTYVSAQRIFEYETAAAVEDELQGLKERFAEGGLLELVQAVEQRSGVEGTEAVYLLATPAGQRIAGNLSEWPSGAPLTGRWTRVRVERGGQSVNIGARAFKVENRLALLVGRDLRAQRRFSAALAQSGALAMLAAILLASAAAYLLNRVVMRRIGDIDGTARAIVAGDLTRRIPLRDGSDEFGRLAATLNGMLERIEMLVVELRTVTDSLAHDLRTPLTRLKTQIQRGADAELPASARKDALGSAADEADRLLASFSAMIDMARAEAGGPREQFTVIDLAALVSDVWELHQPLADDMGVGLTFEAGATPKIRGHEQFLAQLVSNLVDNALKHGARRGQPGAEIDMRVDVEGDMAVVSVADHGPGIPADQRELALKRFGRLDEARTTSGSGLGLSLAATLARMHGGELLLEDNAPGLKVRVKIPRLPA